MVTPPGDGASTTVRVNPPEERIRPDVMPDGASLIVAVGNLYPVKGHRYLVDAIGVDDEYTPMSV